MSYSALKFVVDKMTFPDRFYEKYKSAEVATGQIHSPKMIFCINWHVDPSGVGLAVRYPAGPYRRGAEVTDGK